MTTYIVFPAMIVMSHALIECQKLNELRQMPDYFVSSSEYKAQTVYQENAI